MLIFPPRARICSYFTLSCRISAWKPTPDAIYIYQFVSWSLSDGETAVYDKVVADTLECKERQCTGHSDPTTAAMLCVHTGCHSAQTAFTLNPNMYSMSQSRRNYFHFTKEKTEAQTGKHISQQSSDRTGLELWCWLLKSHTLCLE